VVEVGSAVDPSWAGQLVFAFQPHCSHFITAPDSLFPIADLPADCACFLPHMETAVNFVQDAAPIVGERALVLGQGIVGLLTASLLAEFPLENLVTADCYELRRDASQAIGGKPDLNAWLPCASPVHPEPGADLSRSPAARRLDDVIALTRFSGRVIGRYGESARP
jgi:hypothetical protein